MEASAELIRAGLEKLRRGAPYSVAAVFVRETTEPGLDGASWRVFVTDGHTYGFVTVLWANSNGGERGMDVDREFLATEVEYEAGTLARESRLADLLAQGSVAIKRDRVPEAA